MAEGKKPSMLGSDEREVATMAEDHLRVLMGRLWDAAEYPSQGFEPAWRRWREEHGSSAVDEDHLAGVLQDVAVSALSA